MNTDTVSGTEFVVLDFYPPDFGAPPSSCSDSGALLFQHPSALIVARCQSDVLPCLEQAEAAAIAGSHVVGFITYEAASGINPDLRTPQIVDPELPLLWFMVCDAPVANAALPNVCRGDSDATDYELAQWTYGLDAATYTERFVRAMQHIRDGDSYQINQTFQAHSTLDGSLTELYSAMRKAQRADYSAWIHTGAHDFLSASPELFLHRTGQHLVTRPMKGTRPRGLAADVDAQIAEELRTNPKDRAENVMIVDLLRNDLGRIATIGTVAVSELFEIERYPTVWQMTSTVEADLRPGTGWTDILRATFPCGSVIGAPKVKTMALIDELEQEPRGIYCGSVAWLRPGGDGTMNVAIRTLTVAADGRAVYPVGSGLVADSESAAEYHECLLKAAVLAKVRRAPGELLETIRYEPGTGFYLLDRHLHRLRASSAYFNFEYPVLLDRELRRQAQDWSQPMRVRVLATAAGTFSIEAMPLASDFGARAVRVALADSPIDSADVFLYHKTTVRDVYEQARTDAEDVVLYNERGEITESTIANIAILRDGTWVTPPVSSGLLPGTMRAELLALGSLQERIIRIDDLRRADAIKLFNSVRGEYPATVTGI